MYTAHTHTSGPNYFWFACYGPGWLQVAIISIYVWMYKVVYYMYVALAMSITHQLQNCMHVLRCDIWECGHEVKTEKESKHFVHCCAHFVTHGHLHHTYILSYHFHLHATSLVNLRWPYSFWLTIILEIFVLLIFACLIVVVIYYLHLQESVNIRCNKNSLKSNFQAFNFSGFFQLWIFNNHENFHNNGILVILTKSYMYPRVTTGCV